MKKILYLDCTKGVGGDCLVGALCDLGVKPSALEWEFSKLDVGDYHLHFERKAARGADGIHFSVHEGAIHRHEQDEPCVHAHHDNPHLVHGHGHHPSCGHDEAPHEEAAAALAKVREWLSKSSLDEDLQARAGKVLERLEAASAACRCVTLPYPETDHLDPLTCLFEIVGALAAVKNLQPDEVWSSPLPEEPADEKATSCLTGQLLTDIPSCETGDSGPVVSPVGASLVAELATDFRPVPSLSDARVGHGLGRVRPLGGVPHLRALLGENDQTDASS